MRRWNGWGDSANDYPLKAAGRRFLTQRLGPGRPLPDATLESALARVPPSRLPEHALISRDPEQRLRHARGQSLGDWLALRAGQPEVFPDAVALPENSEQVRQLLDWARQQNCLVIPYGGGTSVAGHINPPAGERPVLTLSLARMDRLLNLNQESQLATFGAGTPGPALERQLGEHGYRLGHYPQSWELSTVGGWVASRSSGQQSMRYGRIEQLFAGGLLETPDGPLRLPTVPASSAGPDLREMVMGSEGRLGVITEVDVRISRLPAVEQFHVAFAPHWPAAVALVRRMVQERVPVSMLRLSNPQETVTQLTLAGHGLAVGALNRYLALRGNRPDEKCMITFGVTGEAQDCRHALARARRHIRAAGGVLTGQTLGRKWEQARFRSPYLRHGLWSEGYAVDTLETCVDWSRVEDTVAAIEAAIREHAGDGEQAHVFTHLSHLYAQGSSIYTTYVFRCSPDYATTRARWWAMKSAASDAIVAHGGTISHQHGVGRDHAPWLGAEKGPWGMAALGALLAHFDPEQRLNPGCLIADTTDKE
ncbi:FAD-binding oxidoreductase [Alcanivorax sp. N3-2A]|nr:FAD-binding oxidoreductase [Alcanivorax sp. N3-2A]|tara:strand:- start:35375 stop:36985 length:1611 start_codon:yes stop_codon:yes gene_type:complete